MKKLKTEKRLKLERETIRRLAEAALALAAGGLGEEYCTIGSSCRPSECAAC